MFNVIRANSKNPSLLENREFIAELSALVHKYSEADKTLFASPTVDVYKVKTSPGDVLNIHIRKNLSPEEHALVSEHLKQEFGEALGIAIIVSCGTDSDSRPTIKKASRKG
ncbi:MAG: hypothetical protein KDH96_02650 [Candidatus Riesia sp.]|nr:hypothetical protein [Candidatus Riesia sp.]